MTIKKLIRILTITALLSLPYSMHAQPLDPNQGGATPTDPPPPDGDPGAPIDGGLGILLAAGAAYGVKKYRDGRKEKEEEKE